MCLVIWRLSSALFSTRQWNIKLLCLPSVFTNTIWRFEEVEYSFCIVKICVDSVQELLIPTLFRLKQIFIDNNDDKDKISNALESYLFVLDSSKFIFYPASKMVPTNNALEWVVLVMLVVFASTFHVSNGTKSHLMIHHNPCDAEHLRVRIAI